MSYCRFGPDCDVHVYMATDDDLLHCCWCQLLSLPGNCTDFVAKDHGDMLNHLRKHVDAGHKVPADAITTLESEAEGNASRRAQ